MVLAFGYFAFLDYDNHAECRASEYSDLPIPADSAMVGTNVAMRFRRIIRFGFFVSLMEIGRATASVIVFRTQNVNAMFYTQALHGCTGFLNLFFLFVATTSRFEHTGRVCSGHFLPSNADHTGYL